MHAFSNGISKAHVSKGAFDFILCQNGEIMAANVDYFAFVLMGSLGRER